MILSKPVLKEILNIADGRITNKEEKEIIKDLKYNLLNYELNKIKQTKNIDDFFDDIIFTFIDLCHSSKN